MLLRFEALALAGIAVILAVALPPVLARATWSSRDPRAALILWQAIGLGGGLSILSAGLTLAAADVGTDWIGGMTALPRNWPRLAPLGWLGVVVTVVAGAWLLSVLTVSTLRVIRVRRAHRQRLDLLTDDVVVRERGDSGTELAIVRMLDHSAAAAYCLPGLRPQIVLSSGTVAALSDPELAAVVIHERAHARGRHDLVIHPFRAWRETFAFLPAAGVALDSVELLVEMLADDVARERCGTTALAGAIARLAETTPSDAHLAVRTARLSAPVAPLPATARAAIYVLAAALIATPPLLLVLS